MKERREGIAQFKLQSPTCIEYEENVKIKFNYLKIVNKSYKINIYIYDSEKDIISKKFSDNSAFYDLDFKDNNQNAAGMYTCGLDYYKALYHFLDKNNFTLKYMSRALAKITLFTQNIVKYLMKQRRH